MQQQQISFYKIQGRENGMALVVGLLLLLVMTILGLAAMRSTTLQERMSANSMQQIIVFQSAESALENMWNSIVQASDPTSTPLIVQANNGATPTASVTTGNSTTNSATLVALNSNYVDCLDGGGQCRYYRIRATSTQANTNASETHDQIFVYRK